MCSWSRGDCERVGKPVGGGNSTALLGLLAAVDCIVWTALSDNGDKADSSRSAAPVSGGFANCALCKCPDADSEAPGV